MKTENKKAIFRKNMILIILFLISINIAYAQSIGATPEKRVETKINTPISSYFGVSQGADYPEKITIEGNYDWLNISEREFILESKTGKTIRLDINIKRQGTYRATLRVCGSPITSKGTILSTKACTSHKLTVIATGDRDVKKEIMTVIAILLVIAAIYYITDLIKKGLLTKKKKK
ncbi:MAG: hypothetical protein KAU20_02145 [Nanoarchaeota archaeon]|nr:hypothetical protein [Nanoarchaeota archaeon]